MEDRQYIDVKENIDRYVVHVDMPDVDGKYREIAKLMADISEVTGYGMITKGTTLYIDKEDIGKDVLDEILKEANDRIKDKVEKETDFQLD